MIAQLRSARPDVPPRRRAGTALALGAFGVVWTVTFLELISGSAAVAFSDAAALSAAADPGRRGRWSASAEQYGAQSFLYDGRARAAEIILAAFGNVNLPAQEPGR